MQNVGEERFLVKGTASAKALRQHHAWGVFEEQPEGLYHWS